MDDAPIDIPASFRGLDPNKPVEIYRRKLPHWRQEGATYFVTFRQHDALPAAALRDLKIESRNFEALLKEQALTGEALSEARDRFHSQYGSLLDRHLDSGAGSCHLKSPTVASLVLKALRHFDISADSEDTRYDLDTALIMPNHCHLVVRPSPGYALEKILQSWKTFTAREINKAGDLAGQFWQPDNFDRIIRDETHYRAVVRYIRNNPVKASLRSGEFLLYDTTGSQRGRQ